MHDLPQNLFFLCGPHGAGKTTLSHRIKEALPNVVLPELETRVCRLDTSPLERITLKLCERALENFEAVQLARQLPDKIILANRCIYDGDTYARAYHDLDWISEEEYHVLHQTARIVFPKDVREPRAIVLNPPSSLVLERVRGRWETERKKWREEDTAYCKAVRAEYTLFRDNPNILYLEDSTYVEPVISWLKDRYTVV